MTAETRPNQYVYPQPTKEQDEEMSLPAAFHRVVDDLFTHQVVAETLAVIADDAAMERLVQTWKQSLAHHLAETAQVSLENVVATLNLFQGHDGPPVTDVERQEWQEIEARHTPFEVSTICREDLRGIIANEEITTLSDEEMQQIATKMSDAYQDGGYWVHLAEAAQSILQQRQADDALTSSTPPEPAPDASLEPELQEEI